MKMGIENTNNLLFDLAKIRCELVFLNKAKHIEESEGLKIVLNDMFKTINIDLDVSTVSNKDKTQQSSSYKRFMISYSEREQANDENALILVNNITFTLYISIGEEEKQERFISTYQKHLTQIHDDPNKMSLNHLIIFFTKNTAETLVVNQNDHIHFTMLQPDDIQSIFKTVLNKILSDYNTYIQSKATILNTAGTALVIKDVIEIKNRCEEYLQIGNYNHAYQIIPLLSDMIKIPTEQIKFKECLAITKFLIDYENYRQNMLNTDKDKLNKEGHLTMMIFNQDIEKLYEGVFTGYKKAKQQELLVESYLRLSSYYSFFIDKLKDCLETIQKAQMEALSLHSLNKIKVYLHCYTLLSDMSLKRKGCLYLYLAIAACYEAPQSLLNIIPYLFKEINKTFPIYDVFTDQINSIDSFNIIHAEIIKNGWKKISFCECKRESPKQEMVEVDKKRIEKDYALYVIKNLVKYDKLLLTSTWQPIQYNILINLITYYKGIGDYKMKIANMICLLQTLSDFLALSEQKYQLEEHNKDSIALQEKINLNMIRFPILIKIIPIPGDIKIEKKNKFTMNKGNNNSSNSNSNSNSNRNTMSNNNNSIFIYNPWEKTKGVNYFWTVNSFQIILIELYNPLSIQLTINKINIIFEGVIPFSFPSSVTIEPLSFCEVIFKIRPSKEGLTSIKGIKYEIENTIGIQYVDSDGNGIFYSYENLSKDPYSLANHKKEVLQLDNIQIFPEMPRLDMKVLDESSKMNNNTSLELYEYQYFPFSFLLENISTFPIEEIQVFIYGFKKDDYKILLEELVLKKEEEDGNSNGNLIDIASNYVFNYNYIHRKGHKKIEFRFYYKFKSEEYDKLTVKPFCYYLRKVSSRKLFKFNHIRVASMLSNRITSDIIKSDPRIKQDYLYCFSSNRYYISFELSLLLEGFEMQYEFINNGENLLKKNTIDYTSTHITPKEISMVVENKYKLNEIEMHWELLNHAMNNNTICCGKIDLYQLITNELDYRFMEGISFDITTKQMVNEDGIRCILLKHTIENKSKKVYRNLRFFIYLYQTYEDILVFNTNLNKNVFYEGSLFYAIQEIKGMEVLNYEVMLYPPENEIISTTCVLIDDDYKVVHISTVTKQCCLIGGGGDVSDSIIPFAMKKKKEDEE